MASGSTIAVYSAIFGNSLVMVAKFIAFFITGSSAMLSEGIHSFADLTNQCLLAFGIRRSRKKADQKHPYGYTRERFIWALISAVGIFFLGCGVTMYHGIHTMLDPKPISDYSVALIILFVSLCIEGTTLVIAYRAIRGEALRARVSLSRYFESSSDPMGIAVILEDSAAVIGIIIAASGILLSQYTGNTFWDGLATTLIGLLLGCVAIFLTYRTKGLLVGEAIPVASRAKILSILAKDPVVDKIYDVKTAVLGAENHRFKAEIEFDGEQVAQSYLNRLDLDRVLRDTRDKESLKMFLINYGDHLINTLGDEVDRLEAKIREAVPEVRHIDIESN